MGKIYLLVCAVWPFIILSCGSLEIAKREIEPNDSRQVAQGIYISTKMQGVFASAKDVDVYKLEISPEEIISISFQLEKALNVYEVNLTDELGHKIVSYTLPKGSTKEKLIHPNMGGKTKLFIEIRSQDFFHPEGYVVYVRKTKSAFSEVEPNGSIIEASKLVNNGTLRATLSPIRLDFNEAESEEDWYKVSYKTLNDTSVIVSTYLSPIVGIDTRLQVVDIRGRTIMIIDNNGVGEHEEFHNVRLKEPHQAFIRVTGVGVFKSNFIPYEINTEVSSLPPNTSFEPSDSINQAILFSEEAEEIESRVDYPGDIDFFELNVNQIDGALLNLVLYPGENQDLSFEIVDGLGDRVTFSDIDGKGEIESIVNMLVYQERLYAKVTPSNGSSTATYRIKRYYRPYQEGLEKEPNDQVNQSTSIKMDDLYSGYLSRQDDVDFFSFNVHEKGDYKLEMMGVTGTKYKVLVTENGFEPILQSENLEGRTNMALYLDQGTYFIELSLMPESAVKADEVYRMKLSINNRHNENLF